MSPRTPEQFEKVRTNRRALILKSALEVFANEGYHGASISRISKLAGISKGLMYNYFSSKEELLQILIGDLFDAEMEVMYTLLKRPFDEEVFIDLIKMGSEILKKNPKQWMLYFSMATQPEVAKIIEERFTPERVLFTEKMFEFFQNKGDENPALQMQFFGATMTGLKLSYIMSPDTFPINEIEEMIINQFVKS